MGITNRTAVDIQNELGILGYNPVIVQLKDVKKGELVRIVRKGWSVDGETNTFTTMTKTYIKGEYIREEKKYSLIDFDDTNREKFVKGSQMVDVGFIQ